MNNYKLFVYGSLRSGFKHEAYQYIAQYFKALGHATVKGILYDKGAYPIAVPTTDEKFLQGELYTINQPNEFSYIIGQLDDYEGLNVEEGETAVFKREETTVYCNGEQYTAWVYWYAGTVADLTPIPSGDVLQYLKEKNKL